MEENHWNLCKRLLATCCKLYCLGLIFALMGTFLWTFFGGIMSPITVVITAPFTGSNEDSMTWIRVSRLQWIWNHHLQISEGVGRSNVGDLVWKIKYRWFMVIFRIMCLIIGISPVGMTIKKIKRWGSQKRKDQRCFSTTYQAMLGFERWTLRQTMFNRKLQSTPPKTNMFPKKGLFQ